MNGIIKRLITSVTEQFAEDLDKCLPWILMSYRELPVTGLGFSQYELMFGRPIRGLMPLIKSSGTTTETDKIKPNVVEYFLDLRERMSAALELANESK